MRFAAILERSRVWLALLSLPLLLATAFLPVAGYLAIVRGLRGDELVRAVEPIAPYPATAAFVASFFVTRALAAKDGRALRDLGWIKPAASDLALGLLAAALLASLNAYLLYPWVQAAQPSFDPALRAIALPSALLMMTAAVAAEETLYRGYAFETLKRRYGVVAAILVTSLCYALLAPGAELPLKVWALGFGAVLCLIRIWRQNLWPVAIAHLLVALGPKLVASARSWSW